VCFKVRRTFFLTFHIPPPSTSQRFLLVDDALRWRKNVSRSKKKLFLCFHRFLHMYGGSNELRMRCRHKELRERVAAMKKGHGTENVRFFRLFMVIKCRRRAERPERDVRKRFARFDRGTAQVHNSYPEFCTQNRIFSLILKFGVPRKTKLPLETTITIQAG
jgi:hypothetical protein